MIIEEMTMVEFEEGLKRTRTVLIPYGATEEHGRHLPLGTDTLMAATLARRLAERRALFVAPALPYGVCRSTADHPGTLTITTETLKSLTRDLIATLHNQGLRTFVLLTGHAGGTHGAALVDAGEEALCRFDDIRVAVLTELSLVEESAADLIETPGDSHAGEIETSRLLHSHPDLVKGEGEREFPSFPRGILVRNKRRFWPGGVWGDPSRASAEKGVLMEERVVKALERKVSELEGWQEPG